MTRTFLFTAFLLACAATLIARAQTPATKSTDQAAIRAVVEDYLSAEPARLKHAFLATTNLYTTDDKQNLRTIPFEEYFQHVSANTQPDEHHSTIDFIDQTGNTAIAKATTIRTTAKVTDYLSVVRIQGNWQIVNKIFSVERPAADQAAGQAASQVANEAATQPAQTQQQSASPARPCAASDHRIFDFMVGLWRTSSPANVGGGATEGASTIETVLDGCIIHEHRNLSRDGKRLFDGDGYWGYDSVKKQWLLFYMDDQSHMQVYEGRQDGGKIGFYRERPDPDGKPILIRIVYTPTGNSAYTQAVERSADNGATWQLSGVTTYQRNP